MKSLRFTYKTGAALSGAGKILKRRAELPHGYRELIQFAAAALSSDGTHPAIENACFIKDNELAATDGLILIRIAGQPGTDAAHKGHTVTPQDFAEALASDDPAGFLYRSAAADPAGDCDYPDIDHVTPKCAEYSLNDSSVRELELHAERVNLALSCGTGNPCPCRVSLSEDGVSLSAVTPDLNIRCSPVPAERTVSYPPDKAPDQSIACVRADRLARALTLMEICDPGSVRAHFAGFDRDQGTAYMLTGTAGPFTVTVVIVGTSDVMS